jgi:hypothetical protein
MTAPYRSSRTAPRVAQRLSLPLTNSERALHENIIRSIAAFAIAAAPARRAGLRPRDPPVRRSGPSVTLNIAVVGSNVRGLVRERRRPGGIYYSRSTDGGHVSTRRTRQQRGPERRRAQIAAAGS